MLLETVLSKVSDWRYIDFVCIKSKSTTLSTAIYYWNGHPVFERELSLYDVKYIDFTQKIGCYAASEKISDGNDLHDRFYIKVNVTDSHQEQLLIDYLLNGKVLSEHQKNILSHIRNISTILNDTTDYRALYYCGFSKLACSNEYDGIRFYFKTFGADESIKKDMDCVCYLEAYEYIRNDSALQIVKELILENKASLRCIGLEFTENSSIKIKYYLYESLGGYVPTRLLEVLKKYPLFSKDAENLISVWDEFRPVPCIWMQISSGYHDKDSSISVYLNGDVMRKEKYYSLREGLILRDIGGISFIIDIHEKSYYDLKKLLSVNETGQIIFTYLTLNGVCNLDGIVSYLKTFIKNYSADLYPIIYADCKAFIEHLQSSGYLEEVT